MSPQTVLSVTQCLSCGPNSLADKLETGLLQIILGILGAPMTQSEIMDGAACYVCLGLSLPEAIRMALLNEIAANVGPGGGCDYQDMQVAWEPTNLKLGDHVGIYIRFVNGLTSLTLSGLSSDSSITIENNPDLLQVSFPHFQITDPNLNGFGSIQIDTNVVLQSLSMPSLVTVNGNLYLDSNALTSVNLSSLVTVTGYVTLSYNHIPQLTIGLLASVQGGNFSVTFDDTITSVSVPSLTSLPQGQFNIESNPLLTSISAPLLASAQSGISGAFCPNLVAINFASYVPVNGNQILFQGCALPASQIEPVLRACVVAGVTTCVINFSGGTNAGLLSLSVQGQADYATLFAAGNTITLNP